MSDHYNLMPSGDCVVMDHPEVMEHCGSLWPFITTKKNAISHAKSVKKQFPNVKFVLTRGDTWGSQELIAEF